MNKSILILLSLVTCVSTFANPVAVESQKILGTTTILNINYKDHYSVIMERPSSDKSTIHWSYDKSNFLKTLNTMRIKVDASKLKEEVNRIYVLVFEDDSSEGIETITLDRGVSRIYVDMYESSGGHTLDKPRKNMKWSKVYVLSMSVDKWSKSKVKTIWKRSPSKETSIKM